MCQEMSRVSWLACCLLFKAEAQKYWSPVIVNLTTSRWVTFQKGTQNKQEDMKLPKFPIVQTSGRSVVTKYSFKVMSKIWYFHPYISLFGDDIDLID